MCDWDATDEREMQAQVHAEDLQTVTELLDIADQLFEEMAEQETMFSLLENCEIDPI